MPDKNFFLEIVVKFLTNIKNSIFPWTYSKKSIRIITPFII